MKRRIVVKIGSQVLCDACGALNREVMADLARQVGGLAAQGHQLLLVSSGAVAEPKAVRYAFTSEAMPNLMNKEGLPASPFRTDDW